MSEKLAIVHHAADDMPPNPHRETLLAPIKRVRDRAPRPW